jgi:hypothetical protein
MVLISVVVAVLAWSSASATAWTRMIALGLVAMGVCSNLLVICANKGRMPAQTETIPPEYEDGYQIMDAQTRLSFLGDWIQIRGWLISPGDVCLYLGLAIAPVDRFMGRIVEV